MENSQSSFWQFSDQLRLQTSSLANLSLNDSIWSTSYGSKKPEERRNFEVNSVNDGGWKVAETVGSLSGPGSKGVFEAGLNGGFNKGIFSTQSVNFNSYSNSSYNLAVNSKWIDYSKKGWKIGLEDEHGHGKSGKKNKNFTKEVKKENSVANNGEKNAEVDKRFKTLPPAESLPRNETVGGYIFVCNNDTNIQCLPSRYRDSVRQITPGLPLFLYNYSTHQLHGVFEAASFGGTNINPLAWEDKKNPGESRFPAQVRVITRKQCEPLDEDAFRPILHHYDGPKFRLELNIPETLSLLDIFTENNPEHSISFTE